MCSAQKAKSDQMWKKKILNFLNLFFLEAWLFKILTTIPVQFLSMAGKAGI